MNNNFTFILPLLNARQAWGAAEVRAATSSVSSLQEACTICPEQPKLLTIDPAWLSDERFDALLSSLTPDQAIFSLPLAAFTEADGQARIASNRQQGYVFAANDLAEQVLMLEMPPLPAGIDYLILPVMLVRDRLPDANLARLNGSGIKLIATGVADDELLAWGVSKGFRLFSGEFIVKHDELPASGTDPSKLQLLKLLSLVVQDADTRQLEEVFKQEPKLSYNLMRLVNSVSMGGGQSPISNFGQAITRLGRRQLQRWLQLLIYAGQFGNAEPNPLMLQAALRGRLLDELTAKLSNDSEQHDYGFMTGIFSLLDIQLGIRMADIVTALPLNAEVHAALINRQGLFGELLIAVEAIEQRDFPTAIAALEKNGVTPEMLSSAQRTAFEWVSRLNIE